MNQLFACFFTIWPYLTLSMLWKLILCLFMLDGELWWSPNWVWAETLEEIGFKIVKIQSVSLPSLFCIFQLLQLSFDLFLNHFFYFLINDFTKKVSGEAFFRFIGWSKQGMDHFSLSFILFHFIFTNYQCIECYFLHIWLWYCLGILY